MATAFLESTRAEADKAYCGCQRVTVFSAKADAKYRRKLACRAARAEAAGQAKGLRGSTGLAASHDDKAREQRQVTAEIRWACGHVVKAASPSPANQHRTFNMDGKFAPP